MSRGILSPQASDLIVPSFKVEEKKNNAESLLKNQFSLLMTTAGGAMLYSITKFLDVPSVFRLLAISGWFNAHFRGEKNGNNLLNHLIMSLSQYLFPIISFTDHGKVVRHPSTGVNSLSGFAKLYQAQYPAQMPETKLKWAINRLDIPEIKHQFDKLYNRFSEFYEDDKIIPEKFAPYKTTHPYLFKILSDYSQNIYKLSDNKISLTQCLLEQIKYDGMSLLMYIREYAIIANDGKPTPNQRKAKEILNYFYKKIVSELQLESEITTNPTSPSKKALQAGYLNYSYQGKPIADSSLYFPVQGNLYLHPIVQTIIAGDRFLLPFILNRTQKALTALKEKNQSISGAYLLKRALTVSILFGQLGSFNYLLSVLQPTTKGEILKDLWRVIASNSMFNFYPSGAEIAQQMFSALIVPPNDINSVYEQPHPLSGFVTTQPHPINGNALYAAAYSGQAPLVKFLLDQGIQTTDAIMNAAFLRAICTRINDLLTLLLEALKSRFANDSQGLLRFLNSPIDTNTPTLTYFILALRFNYQFGLKKFMEAGVDIDDPDEKGETRLTKRFNRLIIPEAVLPFGETEIKDYPLPQGSGIRHLLKEIFALIISGANLKPLIPVADSKDEKINYLLAMLMGNLGTININLEEKEIEEILEKFFSAGLSIQTRILGRTLLTYALENGLHPVAYFLLLRGADLNEAPDSHISRISSDEDDEATTFFRYLTQKENALEDFIKAGAKFNLLTPKIENLYLRLLVKWIGDQLKNGKQITVLDNIFEKFQLKVNTPLRSGYYLLNIVLEEWNDSDDKLPPHESYLQLVHYLLQKGANINQIFRSLVDDRNNFILRVAEHQPHMLVSILPNLTFSLFCPSNPGTDVLSAAVLRKDVETLRLLIQRGAQLDGLLSRKETDKYTVNLLQQNAGNEEKHAVELLLDLKATPRLSLALGQVDEDTEELLADEKIPQAFQSDNSPYLVITGQYGDSSTQITRLMINGAAYLGKNREEMKKCFSETLEKFINQNPLEKESKNILQIIVKNIDLLPTDNIIALGSILKASAEIITTDQKPETSASSPICSSVAMFPENNKRKGENNQNCQSENYKKPRT